MNFIVAKPRTTNNNYRNSGGLQQIHNVPRVQGQNLVRPQGQSQANLNAQRSNCHTVIGPGQVLTYNTPEVVHYTRVDQLPGNDVARVLTIAPQIPPLPSSNSYHTMLEEPSTSFTHLNLPEPLVPVNSPVASGSVSKHTSVIKPHPIKQPTTYHEITLDLSTYLPMMKASIKEVKDPKFLQFHKQLNKTKPLSDIRLSLINNQHLSDVQLIVGDKKEVIYGHKMFLITASSLFLTHFESNHEVELIVENVETPILLELLKYCYTSQVNITEQIVLELLKAANYLKVRQLSNVCHSFISNLFNEDSIFVIFEKALEQKNELFEKKCVAFMLNNEEKCFTSKGFYKIGFSSLLDIVGRCKFSNEKNEEIIKKWNYGAENMVFAPTENKSEESSKPVKPHPAQSANVKVKKAKAKASTSASANVMTGPLIPSLLDLNLNTPQTSDFVYRDDDNESIVSKDDDKEMRTRIFVNGFKNRGVSEFRYVYLSSCIIVLFNRIFLLQSIGFILQKINLIT